MVDNDFKKHKISLTDFIDVFKRPSTKKATAIQSIFNREDYHPSRDFYRQAREFIKLSTVTKNIDIDSIEDFINNLRNKKKTSHYEHVVTGYFKFLKRKNYQFFLPERFE